MQALLAEGSPAKKPYSHRARRCGGERVFQRVVSRCREPGNYSRFSHLCRRHGVEIDLVIVHAEGRSRGSVAPLQVIPAPAGAVTLVYKPGVVSDDISAYGMNAMADNLIGHILQRRQWGAGAFGLKPEGHTTG